MKKKQFNILIILIILIITILFTSCRTTKTNCDAYGNNSFNTKELEFYACKSHHNKIGDHEMISSIK